ncbi:MAG TPA: hypothetical protein VFR58_03870 [Flavisolibacter sp.]|nr:hypothetical protein [Flavisolibacter sp.]
MDDVFDLPVLFRGEELLFPSRLLAQGYSYKVAVDINGQTIFFEPDEERQWRALADPDMVNAAKPVHPDLLQAIVEALEEVTK